MVQRQRDLPGQGEVELLLLSALFVCVGYSDDPVHGAGEEDGLCGGGDMNCWMRALAEWVLGAVFERQPSNPQRFNIYYEWILLSYGIEVVILQTEILTNIYKKCECIIELWL